MNDNNKIVDKFGRPRAGSVSDAKDKMLKAGEGRPKAGEDSSRIGKRTGILGGGLIIRQAQEHEPEILAEVVKEQDFTATIYHAEDYSVLSCGGVEAKWLAVVVFNDEDITPEVTGGNTQNELMANLMRSTVKQVRRADVIAQEPTRILESELDKPIEYFLMAEAGIEFIRNNPDFYVNEAHDGYPSNSEIIQKWLAKQAAPITALNLEIAFRECKADLEPMPPTPQYFVLAAAPAPKKLTVEEKLAAMSEDERAAWARDPANFQTLFDIEKRRQANRSRSNRIRNGEMGLAGIK